VSRGGGFSALQAIKLAIEPIVNSQTKLEASQNPTLHLVSPMPEHVRKRLTSLMATEASAVRQFSPCVMQHANRVKVHCLWEAAPLLHPRLKDCHVLTMSGGGTVFG